MKKREEDRPPQYLIEAVAFLRSVIEAAGQLQDERARKFVLDCLYEAQITMAKKRLESLS